MGLFSSDSKKEKIEYHKSCIEKLKNEADNYKTNMARAKASFSHTLKPSQSQRAAHKNTIEGYKRNIAKCKEAISKHKEKIADLRKG